MSDSLVPLCDVTGTFDAQAIRASLEARGVFTLVDGEHQRNMLGQFTLAGAVPLRIMVPRSQLRLAYQLVLEIIPDLPAPRFDDETHDSIGREPMPLRRALPEDLLPYPEASDDDDASVDDDPQDSDEDPADKDEDDMAELRQRRSLLGPRIGVAMLSSAVLSFAIADSVVGLVSGAIVMMLVITGVLPISARQLKPQRTR